MYVGLGAIILIIIFLERRGPHDASAPAGRAPGGTPFGRCGAMDRHSGPGSWQTLSVPPASRFAEPSPVPDARFGLTQRGRHPQRSPSAATTGGPD